MNKPYVFDISVGDDPDHDDLTAEISVEGVCLAVITQEQGLQHARIELFPRPGSDRWDIELSDFLDALNRAKARLWDLRRN